MMVRQDHSSSCTQGFLGVLFISGSLLQVVKVVHPERKLTALLEYLQAMAAGQRVMVFCATKRKCDWLSNSLTTECSRPSAAIHGDKSQSQRDYVLRSFKIGRTTILVATDVAARGALLHIPMQWSMLQI